MSKLPPKTPQNMNGLVLAAGGARGAYQAGVLKRVSEIKALAGKPSPFQIITGSSAGAINGAVVAANSANFIEGTKQLVRLWSNLDASQVYRFDPASLFETGTQAVLDFALGGLFGAGRLQSLLDATPLHQFIENHFDGEGINRAIQSGHLYAFGVTATGYHSGKAFTFIQGQLGHALWNKSRRVALRTHLTAQHILASAAIPIVFPPVPLKTGDSVAYFGDGAMRLTAPLSPAIRLGAERLFAIGVRCQESADSLLRSELSTHDDYVAQLQRPPLSQICGTLMNAIFLDHLDTDIEHLNRMNHFVSAYLELEKKIPAEQQELHEPMRIIQPFVVSPSADIAVIAKTLEHRMPRRIRYFMEGLGQPDAQSADLMSFLLFDKAFTRELIQLGYHDAGLRIDEIEHFLLEGKKTH